MRHATRNFAAVVLALAAAGLQAQESSSAPSQTDTEINLLKMEIQRLRADVEIMKGHIGRVVQYLQQRDAQSIAPQLQPQLPPQAQAQQPGSGFNPAGIKVSTAGAPTLGRADAPVTIVEFSDFECPFCQRFFKSTLPEIKRDYLDTGKVRYVFMDFPLEQMHAQARKAAEAAHCAGDQGKFWEMHDILFEQSANLDPRQYAEYARTLKLEGPAFELCLGSGKQSARINRGLASGRSLGINATPSFIITRTERGDAVAGGKIITGAQPYEQFRQAIEQALAAK
jgi:protein-disulfide isomerase